MKDAGASADDILEYVADNRLDIDAVKLRSAGFSLSELVQACKNNKNLRDVTPLLTTKTLFDSQLQQAGWSPIFCAMLVSRG